MFQIFIKYLQTEIKKKKSVDMKVKKKGTAAPMYFSVLDSKSSKENLRNCSTYTDYFLIVVFTDWRVWTVKLFVKAYLCGVFLLSKPVVHNFS